MQCKEIQKRCSTRLFQKEKKIPEEALSSILIAGAMAPSGHNGQPWRFRAITEREIIQRIAGTMKQNGWIASAPCLIAVGLDQDVIYDAEKDAMSAGAAIQNMLLEACSNGIDSCWVSGGLSEETREILGINSNIKLMAIVAMGYSRVQGRKIKKKDLKELLF